MNLIVIAKAPVAGRVKTRLSPPCSPAQAAALARAALADTLAAVAATPATRRVLALDGPPGPWVPAGFEPIAQRSGAFDRRLAGAFADVGGPALLVAMDTPQVTPALLAGAARRLLIPGIGAVLGRTPDGGYWTIGLRRPDAAVFLGVPMSTAATADAQRGRLDALGLVTAELTPLTDVDDIHDARSVAAAAPDTRFARALRESGHAADEQEAVAQPAA